MKKLFFFLIPLLTIASTTHTISYNPASYVKTEAPLTLEYAKNSCLQGVFAGVALHAAPYICKAWGIEQTGVFSALVVAGYLAQVCYENYSADHEQKNCEEIAHTWNTKATDKAKELTGVRLLPTIKIFGPEQFKMQHESHRAAATLGGFTTGFLHADALCRGISWMCA